MSSSKIGPQERVGGTEHDLEINRNIQGKPFNPKQDSLSKTYAHEA